jgi:hypothetical protein
LFIIDALFFHGNQRVCFGLRDIDIGHSLLVPDAFCNPGFLSAAFKLCSIFSHSPSDLYISVLVASRYVKKKTFTAKKASVWRCWSGLDLQKRKAR